MTDAASTIRGRPWARRRRVITLSTAAVTVAAGVSMITPAADAAPQPKTSVSADRSVPRNCFAAPVPGKPGVDTTKMTVEAPGLIQARLTGGGDWDLAVFDLANGRVVAASSGLRTHELAEGQVTAGEQLLIQACRYAGQASRAALSVQVYPLPAATAETTQVVEVSTPRQADKRRLQTLDLDLTEHGDKDSVDVVLHGTDDAQKLQKAGFTYRVRIADLAARVKANQRADAIYAAQNVRSALPSGRTSYRRLAGYDFEMKDLARRYPALVRTFVLPHLSIEGRNVGGIEIATNVRNLADGKPIFLNMALHHAREWPAGEHSMEWAYDLLTNYGHDARTTRLVRATRNVVLPVVNPDGFSVSREATPLGDFSLFDYEMKRKNCQPKDSPARYQGGVCANNPAGRLRGTDPNRNYAGFWGGSGASVRWSSDVFRGSEPFSEPETQNIREFMSGRQVTNMITNHTFSKLVLRPPGVADTRPPLDEPRLAALGAEMASHNGYANIAGWQLYDTTGTTEDWSFWNTAGIGYTFEIGPDDFHPQFENAVVGEYLGLAPAAGAGKGGNREAYYAMLESTASAADHSTLTGRAPEGWTLRLHKEFQTPTSPVWQNDFGTAIGDPIFYTDVLDSTLRAPGGTFSWAVNPSTRPFVAGRFGRDPQGPPQANIPIANPPGEPAENTGDPFAGPHEEIPFTVQGMPAVDNGKMTVHIQWSNPDTDWDLYVLNSSGDVVAQSASFGDTTEDAVLFDPPAGEYTAVVVNFDQIDGQPFDDWSGGEVRFASPLPTTFGGKEAWTVTCERPNGSIATVRSVIVDRGQTADLGFVCARKHKPHAG